jgi:lipopolysaccharide assembly outer membrane protein LptD (OstA)
MIRLRPIVLAALSIFGLAANLRGQEKEPNSWEIEALSDESGAEYNLKTKQGFATNGVIIKYSGAMLVAERAAWNEDTGDAIAEGNVRVFYEEQTWTSEHLAYNFFSREVTAQQFRTGKPPVFIEGEGLHAEVTNNVLVATNSFITTDDVSKPAMRVRAKYIKIIPGKRVIARNAILYVGKVPIFYFPYYSRNLGPRANNFDFVPGYRSSFGPFLLSSYNWFLGDDLDGALHLDYRQRRGVGAGPDINYHMGRWGEATLRYYYQHDDDPHANLSGITNSVPENRQRFYFSYLAEPYTNFSVRSQVRYQGDFAILHDFFETEYRQNPQPSTYVEAGKVWQNFSLDLYAQPRVNDFFETVERLPDLRLTGYRQQILQTPFYYESESSVGYYRRRFAESNGLFTAVGPFGTNDYSAARADTFHQILLPETFFGWLNVTPRAGARFTYYGRASGPGATTDEIYRGVFNTGAEISFKASRVWPDVESKILDVNGIRHIVEPSVNYVFVPNPNYSGTNQVPQFDYELPSLRLLPIEFPDYNAIDSVDSQNVVRLGLRNKLQTKRHDEVVDVADWSVYTDWRLRPQRDQSTFADLYSDVVLRPRSWLTFESLTRYDIANRQFRLSFHSVTLQPNDIWSWTLAHYYLRDDLRASPTALGEGNNLVINSLFYKLNENWGFRASQRFDARRGRMEEQGYTLYRDLRSWTAALTFRIRETTTGSEDFGVAFTFSLKAVPRFGLTSDAIHPTTLLGSPPAGKE